MRITGNTVLSQDALAPYYQPYIEHRLDQKGLEAIADNITKAYRAEGYFLSRAHIQPSGAIRTQYAVSDI